MKVKFFCVLGIILIIILSVLIFRNYNFNSKISNKVLTNEVEKKETENRSEKDSTVHIEKGDGSITIETKNTDGELIQGVRYNIYDKNNQYIAKIVTNENGIAKIDGLEYGTYYIKIDYIDIIYKSNLETTMQMNVSENKKDVKGAHELKYVSNSSIELTIKDTNNLPVKGICAEVFIGYYFYKTIETDDNGIATLEHLPAGSYEIKVLNKKGDCEATIEFEENNEKAVKHTSEYVLKN